MAIELRLLTQKSEMLPLHFLIRQLSPRVTPERFAELLDDMLAHGYRMVAAYENENCVGLAGIWTATKIYSGKYIELDNVVIDAARRSAGIGKMLCDFVEELGKKEGVEMLMLDAYRENAKAHDFYKRLGYVPRGFHFLKPIGGQALEHPPVLPDRSLLNDA